MLQHLWKTREISVFDISAEILTPFVCNAIRAGAATIRLGEATLIVRNQVVVSVLSPHMKTTYGASRGEARA